MHRGLKIGLAGSVLALGAAGAVTFRKPHDPDEAPSQTGAVDTPALRSATGNDAGLSGALEIGAGDGQPRGGSAGNTAGRMPKRDAQPLIDLAESQRGAFPHGEHRPRRRTGDRKASAAAAEEQRSTESFEKAREPLEPVQHVVRDGDTLEALAQEYLGSAARSLEIFEGNRRVLNDPELLPIGAVLSITPGSTPSGPPRATGLDDEEAETPSGVDPATEDDLVPVRRHPRVGEMQATGRRTYRIREGDTLLGIARQFYGDAGRFRDIVAANRDQVQDFERLRAGMVLVIP